MFTKSSLLAHLEEKCDGKIEPATYQLIKHYLGRLGSWHRATTRLAKIAICRPQLLTDLRLKVIQPQPAMYHCDTNNAEQELLDLVERLNLGLRTPDILSKLQILHDQVCLQRKKDSVSIETAFDTTLSAINFKPIVHAEVLMADYIMTEGLHYINDDRYIGCSKPSCVCCHFYLGHQPTEIERLSCHGNLWLKWCPPAFSSIEHRRCVETLLKVVTHHLKESIVAILMRGSSITRRLPESTTGITGSSDILQVD